MTAVTKAARPRTRRGLLSTIWLLGCELECAVQKDVDGGCVRTFGGAIAGNVFERVVRKTVGRVMMILGELGDVVRTINLWLVV